MATPLTLPDIIKELIWSQLNEIHTSLPAVITKIDLSTGLISALPLIRDKRSDNKVITYAEIGDIPLMVYSSAGNTARITLPVKVGDVVAIHFSERESSSFILGNGLSASEPKEYSPLGLYPLYAIPSIYPISKAKAIDPENIVIENGTTTITVEPNGKITIASPTEIVENAPIININASSSVTVTSPQTTVNGPLTVIGHTTLQGGVSISGGGSSSAAITGNINIIGDTATTGSISNNGTNIGSSHVHSNPEGGVTGPAQ